MQMFYASAIDIAPVAGVLNEQLATENSEISKIYRSWALKSTVAAATGS